MEFNLTTFAKSLYEMFLTSSYFPKMTEDYMSHFGVLQSDRQKHPKREPLHLDQAGRNCIERSFKQLEDGVIYFDYGDEQMEKTHPYYHILENTPYIRKYKRGSEKTRGSQAKVEDASKRNYELVEWNGKTFTKEYSRNIRGSRKRTNSVSKWAYGDNFKVFINRESNSYLNIHYHYIETTIDSLVYMLAEENGARFVGRRNVGLSEDYLSDLGEINNELSNDILSTFFSFE